MLKGVLLGRLFSIKLLIKNGTYGSCRNKKKCCVKKCYLQKNAAPQKMLKGKITVCLNGDKLSIK
jgi:hypothetical protein